MEEKWLTPYLDRMEEMQRRFFRYFHARIEEEGGLSPSQYFLLRVLESEGSATVSDIADHLGTSVAGATGLIDRLVKSSLVERNRCEQDRRLVRVALSEEGVAELARARTRRRQVMAEFFSPLAPDEVAQLVILYEKLTRCIPVPGGDQTKKE